VVDVILPAGGLVDRLPVIGRCQRNRREQLLVGCRLARIEPGIGNRRFERITVGFERLHGLLIHLESRFPMRRLLVGGIILAVYRAGGEQVSLRLDAPCQRLGHTLDIGGVVDPPRQFVRIDGGRTLGVDQFGELPDSTLFQRRVVVIVGIAVRFIGESSEPFEHFQHIIGAQHVRLGAPAGTLALGIDTRLVDVLQESRAIPQLQHVSAVIVLITAVVAYRMRRGRAAARVHLGGNGVVDRSRNQVAFVRKRCRSVADPIIGGTLRRKFAVTGIQVSGRLVVVGEDLVERLAAVRRSVEKRTPLTRESRQQHNTDISYDFHNR